MPGLTNFLYGFFAGTLGESYDTLDQCISEIKHGFIYNEYMATESFQNGLIVDGVDRIWDILWWVHPVLETCILSASVDYINKFWELL